QAAAHLHTIIFLLYAQAVERRFQIGIGMVRTRLVLRRLVKSKQVLDLFSPAFRGVLIGKKIFSPQQHIAVVARRCDHGSATEQLPEQRKGIESAIQIDSAWQLDLRNKPGEASERDFAIVLRKQSGTAGRKSRTSIFVDDVVDLPGLPG